MRRYRTYRTKLLFTFFFNQYLIPMGIRKNQIILNIIICFGMVSVRNLFDNSSRVSYLWHETLFCFFSTNI
jgi:hypothetical protein